MSRQRREDKEGSSIPTLILILVLIVAGYSFLTESGMVTASWLGIPLWLFWALVFILVVVVLLFAGAKPSDISRKFQR